MPFTLAVAAGLLFIAAALVVWNRLSRASDRIEQIRKELGGVPTEPMLLTHEFQPSSGELFDTRIPPEHAWRDVGWVSENDPNLVDWRDYPLGGARHAMTNVDTQQIPRIESD